MKYTATDTDLNSVTTPAIATSLKQAKKIAAATGDKAEITLALRDFKDEVDSIRVVNLNGKIARLVVVGGADKSLDTSSFRKLSQKLAATLVSLPIKSAIVALEHVSVKRQDLAWKLNTIMQALSHASYQYNTHKSKPASNHMLTQTKLFITNRAAARQSIRLGNALYQGLQLAKDLGNEPPNVCNPTYVLKQARKLNRHAKVRVSNLDEKKMAELNMGAFLAVSQGSDTPGHMIIVQYNGGPKNQKPVALVGKGITFDTGGISLKPPGAMDEMKFDMCGAAAVLGATKAVIEAQLPINLITVVAAAENMPSGRATRPADIVTSASGQTIEILNTDAEGRLVLCDALTHVQTFKPDTIIDVATLTGACIVALGSHASALYANSDKLAQDLLKAGDQSGDRAWQMPMWDDYQSALRSNFADMSNVGGRDAGSVTAACFLKRFVKDVDWAHMDVAGSAFQSGPKKGSTGRPVPLLFDYLCQRAGL